MRDRILCVVVVKFLTEDHCKRYAVAITIRAFSSVAIFLISILWGEAPGIIVMRGAKMSIVITLGGPLICNLPNSTTIVFELRLYQGQNVTF